MIALVKISDIAPYTRSLPRRQNLGNKTLLTEIKSAHERSAGLALRLIPRIDPPPAVDPDPNKAAGRWAADRPDPRAGRLGADWNAGCTSSSLHPFRCIPTNLCNRNNDMRSPTVYRQMLEGPKDRGRVHSAE